MHALIRLATLVLAALLVTGCASGDEPGTRATEAPSSDAPSDASSEDPDEAAPADPCPARIPNEGPREPAEAAPDLTLTASAWVCQYELGGKGWVLDGDPVPVDPALLPDLQDAVDELEPSRQDAVCTRELGPRWMLVTAEGVDLQTVVVDDFGCRDVRVTDDPVAEPAGEGTLSGPADLVDALKRAHRG